MSKPSTANNRLVVFETNKFLIITKQKIGTQFTKAFFEKEFEERLGEELMHVTAEFEIVVNEDLGRWDVNDIEKIQDNAEAFIGIKKNLSKFLNEENYNKDVIVLIRNPWKRFISALIQDFIKPFIYQVDNSRPLEILGQMILTGDDLKWWVDYRNEIVMFVDDQDALVEHPQTLKDCLVPITEELVRGYLKGEYPLQCYHNESYHPLISSILLSNKNKDKVTIVDIDETNLNLVYSRYHTKTKELMKENVSNVWTKVLNKVFDKQPEIKQKIIDELAIEFIAYQSLKDMN